MKKLLAVLAFLLAFATPAYGATWPWQYITAMRRELVATQSGQCDQGPVSVTFAAHEGQGYALFQGADTPVLLFLYYPSMEDGTMPTEYAVARRREDDGDKTPELVWKKIDSTASVPVCETMYPGK